eukprot:TRINITY_DN74551_c0_g1_i1.p1 TRINITY_DN74551_c0_g1~~TRINITY_DN74551_c0_g1_i1.p1  ORF type:complete len:192 (+),score=39.36 TRINITY_DN74551_c0_g1_i1:108-683(+)
MGARCCRPKTEDPVDKLVAVHKKGEKIVIRELDQGYSISGEGVALGDTCIEQDAAYWEVIVSEIGSGPGHCRIGVSADLNGQHLDVELADFAVGPGATVATSAAASAGAAVKLAKGDVVGVAFGQGDVPNLRFCKNGSVLDDCTVTTVRGNMFPAVSVGGGAEVILVFDEKLFKHSPLGRHEAIIPSRKVG